MATLNHTPRDMPSSDTGKNKPSLPGLNEQSTTGKEKAIVLTKPPGPAAHAAQKNKRRKTNDPENIDSDYAEEAEDFFYGEGM